jgi:hypothetical protein
MELGCVLAACDSPERGQGWREQPPGEGVLDRADQIQTGARLQHVAVRTGVECRGDEFVFPVHGQEDDSGFRAISPQLLEGLKATELGHRDVQHDHVGPEAPGKVQRLPTVTRNRHDVKGVSKKAADRFQKCDVIVGEEDARSGGRRDVQLFSPGPSASYTNQSAWVRIRGGEYQNWLLELAPMAFRLR